MVLYSFNLIRKELKMNNSTQEVLKLKMLFAKLRLMSDNNSVQYTLQYLFKLAGKVPGF